MFDNTRSKAVRGAMRGASTPDIARVGVGSAVDPALYYRQRAAEKWLLGYLGTYSEDRQPKLDELLVKPAATIVRLRKLRPVLVASV